MLTYQGWTVATARTGDEVVAQVRATRPDAVIMDLQMPGMDGLAAIHQIRADPTLTAPPIIALSALMLPGDRERCLSAGASAYLTKPVSTPALITTIGDVLAGAGQKSSTGSDSS
jgi:CheY-like chemotaxis protein